MAPAAALMALLLAFPAVAAEPEGVQALSTLQASRSGRSGTLSPRKATKKRRTRRSRRTRRAAAVTGAYFNGGVGVVSVTDQGNDLGFADGTALNLGLGYRLSQEIAVEAAFFASIHDSVNDNARSDNGLTGGSLSLKYYFPLLGIDRLETYGMAGLGMMNIDAGSEEIDGTYFDVGAGLEYRISREAALGGKASLMNVIGDDTNASALSAFNIMGTLTFRL